MTYDEENSSEEQVTKQARNELFDHESRNITNLRSRIVDKKIANITPKRGRPKGSKNKPKDLSSSQESDGGQKPSSKNSDDGIHVRVNVSKEEEHEFGSSDNDSEEDDRRFMQVETRR